MQNNDYKWFIDNYSDLFNKYGASYLIIKDANIIGVCTSYAEGVRKALKTEDVGSFIVQKCNGNESAYTNYISSMNFCIR